jgi:flavin-dependent dehydrogenase
VGIGVGLGTTRRQAPLRGDLARFCALLAERGDIGPGVTPGPVTGGWLRMGGTGTPAAAGNVLLVGDAAGLINPLQGEGIAPGMVSARLAAEAVLAHPGDPGPAYTEALAAAFGGFMPGAAALQAALLQRPVVASAGLRLLTAPGVRRLLAGTWSLYWNGLVDGARPRPSAWSAGQVQRVAGLLAARAAGRAAGPRPAAVTGSAPGRPRVRAGQR